MTKEGLAEAVAKTLDLSKNKGREAVDVVFDSITKALSRGEEVSVSGFGGFRVSKRGARMGVNPRTGERIEIKASVVPKFKAGKALKEAVK